MSMRAKSSDPLIDVSSLSKRYRSGSGSVVALDRINLDVSEGEFIAVLGPSGCGKSTLLSVLGLLEAPDSGSYKVKGVETNSLSFDERSATRNRHIGFVFQAFNLIADMTVRENVALPLRYSDIPRAEHAGRVESLLERVRLIDRAKHYPHQLSGGQQQRVAIARAMVTSPALILADEPTGNLDSKLAIDVIDLFKEFHGEGATIILVTHDEHLASEAARCLSMADGSFDSAS